MSNAKYCELHQQGYLYPANCLLCEGQILKPDVTKCPACGEPTDNGHDREYPPNPYVCSKCMETRWPCPNPAEQERESKCDHEMVMTGSGTYCMKPDCDVNWT